MFLKTGMRKEEDSWKKKFLRTDKAIKRKTQPSNVPSTHLIRTCDQLPFSTFTQSDVIATVKMRLISVSSACLSLELEEKEVDTGNL